MNIVIVQPVLTKLIRFFIFFFIIALGITGCNDTTESTVKDDLSNIDQQIIEQETSNPEEVTPPEEGEIFKAISLQSSINQVQPLTGIVLWADSWNNSELKKTQGYIQLEYAYMRISDVVIGENQYDWNKVESVLNEIKNRGNQAILRWYYVYPGNTDTAVPDYIKKLDDYNETIAKSEGNNTAFPDWSHSTLQQATLEFYSAFSGQYDNDPRIAYLQVGFGLWGEYHIYDPGEELGVNFPSLSYQSIFLKHMTDTFTTLHWSISIDAGDTSNTPIANNEQLLLYKFGNFDDSFMHESHDGYNKSMWSTFDYQTRYQHSPHGGELSYYSNYDQANVLNKEGIYGRSYETLSKQFYITYMIGNDQPSYQDNERIKEAGMANGYQFEIVSFESSANQSKVTVTNNGVAPIYYDAYITINGIRANKSLITLLPGEQKQYLVEAGGNSPLLTIESDRLVDGQQIQFDADL